MRLDRAHGGGIQRCRAPPDVPALGRHFPAVSEPRYWNRSKYLLFAERLQVREKRHKPPQKHRS